MKNTNDSLQEGERHHMKSRNAIGGLSKLVLLSASIVMVVSVLALVSENSDSIQTSQAPNFRIIDSKLTSDYRNITDNAYFVMNFVNFSDRNIDTLTWKTHDDTGKEFSGITNNITPRTQVSIFGSSANTVFSDGTQYTINLFFYLDNGNEFHKSFEVLAGV